MPEIQVDGVTYRYEVRVRGDYDKGMTQVIEVFLDGEGCIGSKEDSAPYGRPPRHHPASTMEGTARLIANEIVGEYRKRARSPS